MKNKFRIFFVILFTLLSVVALTACFKETILTIEISSNGELVDSFEINKGNAISTSINLLRDGYTLEGFYDNAEFSGDKITFPYYPTDSIILYAKWDKEIILTIEISSNGEIVDSFEINKGTAISNSIYLLRDGYTLEGFYDNAEFSGDKITFPYYPTDSIILYAKWDKEIILTIEISSNGELVDSFGINKGNAISTSINLLRDGYTLEGFYDNAEFSGDKITFPYCPADSIILYAKWDKKNATIEISSNGKIVDSFEINKGSAISTSIKLLRDGYTLEGFYDNAEFSGDKITFPYYPTDFIILYAKWEIGELEYKLNEDNETYTIIGKGNTEGNVVIPDFYNDKKVVAIGSYALSNHNKIISLTIGNNVAKIEDSALYSCTELTYIKIPNSLTAIGPRAFGNCFKLEKFIVNNNNQNFSAIDGNLYSKDKKTLVSYADGNNNDSFVVPKGVEIIGETAFHNTHLLTISFPDSLIRIEDNAFELNRLTTLDFPKNLEYIGIWAFAHSFSLTTVTFANNIKYVMDGAFSYSNELINADIGESVIFFGNDTKNNAYEIEQESNNPIPMHIGAPVFNGCEKFTGVRVSENNSYYKSIDGILYSKDITALYHYPINRTDEIYIMPDTVTYVSADAITDCKFYTVTLSENLNTLGFNSFQDCNNLTQISLPKGLTYLDWNIFDRCNSLESINVDANNPTFTSIDGNLYSKDAKTLIRYANGKKQKSFTVPEYVVTLMHNSFLSSDNLEEIIITDNVKVIGSFAFAFCENLKNVVIGKGLETIQNNAFYQSPSLRKIFIPINVKNIQNDAFGAYIDLAIFFEHPSKPDNWTVDFDKKYSEPPNTLVLFWEQSKENYDSYLK